MGLLRRISDERERQIVAHAEPYLETGESVLEWARARHPDGKPRGFVYVTERRLIVFWRGRSDSPGGVIWDEVESWGVQGEAKGGPILAIETSDSSHRVQMRAETQDMTHNLLQFLRRFADLAPKPRRDLSTADAETGRAVRFRADPDVVIGAEKRSLARHTRRIVITVLGVLLVVGGILLSLPLVPGPGFLVIIAGLALLSSEYDWAEDALEWAKSKYAQARRKIKARRGRAS